MIDSEAIKNTDFQKAEIAQEYDNCQFLNCNFTGVILSNIKFIDCQFESCNFSQSIWLNTSLQDCEFFECKMLGLDFSNVNAFLLSVSFTNCQLNLSNFFQLKLKNTSFIGCQLQEVDFTEVDLAKANFERSNLRGAIFDQTNIAEADFRMSENFLIDPRKNTLHKAIFSKNDLAGLIQSFGIQIK